MKERYTPRFYGDISFSPVKGFGARLRRRIGFTLTEVVLAVGVLSLAIVALVGLFGPTMGAVKEVIDRSGALAVADQVNSKLLSDEIYTALGNQTSPTRFSDFAGQLIVRSGGNVASIPTTPKGRAGVLYAWKQFNPNRSEVGNVDLTLWPTVTNDDARGRPFDLGALDGSVYLVLMERGLQQGTNQYTFPGDVDNSAYFPILVSIYEAPMNLISTGLDLPEAELRNYANGLRGKPLFQYTTAKLR